MAYQQLVSKYCLDAVRKIVVVSGSTNEPELLFHPGCEVMVLSFEDDPRWDLGQDWADGRAMSFEGEFDLVLCEQVLEHVIDPARAVQNLKLLARAGGYVHLSAPAINGTHGLPHYHYAGFPPSTLGAFLQNAGLADISVGGWGSKKSAQMYAVCDWTAIKFSAFPRTAFNFGKFSVRTFLSGWRHYWKYAGQELFTGQAYKHKTISWGIARNPG
jgi:SAM-dependent methyltransferase